MMSDFGRSNYYYAIQSIVLEKAQAHIKAGEYGEASDCLNALSELDKFVDGTNDHRPS